MNVSVATIVSYHDVTPASIRYVRNEVDLIVIQVKIDLAVFSGDYCTYQVNPSPAK